jgi:small subunit ribosomal protein S1
LRAFKKGQAVDTVVLSVDPDRERISLGMKQLRLDRLGNYVIHHPVGSTVKGIITSIERRGATLHLGDVDGLLHMESLRQPIDLKVGQKVQAQIVGVDRESGMLVLFQKGDRSTAAREGARADFAADDDALPFGENENS